MSTLSLYNAMGVVDSALVNLRHILKKGEANAAERGIDPDIFLNARLAPDMYSLKRQVYVVTSLAKVCPHRLAGTEAPVYEDTEETFEELYARIDKARGELAKFKPEDIDGKEDRSFTVNFGPTERPFTGISYLSGFIIPNMNFHVTTAYNILRHNGVPLSKLDYFGGGG